ncbi:MAG TPA: ATP-binding protein [Bacteroidales bacterium]|nr:ATP-binding protein [Bacteroidales bacterium]
MKKEITIKSQVENLRIVEKLIDDISLELDLSDELYGNVLVATMEATNNAIIHGNKSDPEKEVLVTFIKTDNEISINIKDQGKGFDYSKVPDPTSPENIEKINGRGVYLMKRLSDDISFEDDGRVVELKFSL